MVIVQDQEDLFYIKEITKNELEINYDKTDRRGCTESGGDKSTRIKGTAVSYTHLDVYKRQVNDGNGCGNIQFLKMYFHCKLQNSFELKHTHPKQYPCCLMILPVRHYSVVQYLTDFIIL